MEVAAKIVRGRYENARAGKGRDVKRPDYPTWPWDLSSWKNAFGGCANRKSIVKKKNVMPTVKLRNIFCEDKEHPYVQEKPYDWIRYQVGQILNLAETNSDGWLYEFGSTRRDGFAVEELAHSIQRPCSVV
jgi:hypothetical protein